MEWTSSSGRWRHKESLKIRGARLLPSTYNWFFSLTFFINYSIILQPVISFRKSHTKCFHKIAQLDFYLHVLYLSCKSMESLFILVVRFCTLIVAPSCSLGCLIRFNWPTAIWYIVVKEDLKAAAGRLWSVTNYMYKFR